MADADRIAKLGIEVRADGVLVASKALQDLTLQGGKAEQAVTKLGATSRASGVGVNALREPLTQLAREALGINPTFARLASVIGMLGAGSAVVVGVTAGLGAIGLAYRAVTKDAREAEEANKKTIQEFQKWLDMQRAAAAGPAAGPLRGLDALRDPLREAGSDYFSLRSTATGRNSPSTLARAWEQYLEELEKVRRAEVDLNKFLLGLEDERVKKAIEASDRATEAFKRGSEQRIRQAEQESAEVARALSRIMSPFEMSQSILRGVDTPDRPSIGGLRPTQLPWQGNGPYQGPAGLRESQLQRQFDEDRAREAAAANRAFVDTLTMIATVAPESIRGLLSIAAGIKELGASAASFSAVGFAGVASSIYGSGNARMLDARGQFQANVEAEKQRRAEEERMHAARLEELRRQDEAINAANKALAASTDLMRQNVAVQTLRIQGFTEEADSLQLAYERHRDLTEAMKTGDEALVQLYRDMYELQDAAMAAAKAISDSQKSFERITEVTAGWLAGLDLIPITNAKPPRGDRVPSSGPIGPGGIPWSVLNPWEDPLFRWMWEQQQLLNPTPPTAPPPDMYRGSPGAMAAQDAYTASTFRDVMITKGLMNMTEATGIDIGESVRAQLAILQRGLVAWEETAINTRRIGNGGGFAAAEAFGGSSQLQ